MKTLFIVAAWVLTFSLSAQTKVIVDNGSPEKRINILILGDGYLNTEMDKFEDDAQHVMDELLLSSPYKEYANFMNGIIVKVPSNESGTDHPANAIDVSEPVFPQGTKDTYYSTTFDGAQIHRLVITGDQSAAYTVASVNFPSYDQILMIVNSPEYGGSGGAIATFSTHSSSAEIGIHEMGHSFAKLADEYWAGPQYANEKPNMTANDDPNSVKWKTWLNSNGVGIYPYGTSGVPAEWFRPHQACKMRQLNVPFCSVCKEQTIDRIYDLVSPIESFTPVNLFQTYVGAPIEFKLDLVLPNPNTLKIEWRLDEQVVGADVSTLQITNPPTDVSTLTVTVTDTTLLSQKYAVGYVFSESWEITNTTVALIEADDRLFYKIYPNPVSDILSISFDGDFPAKETEIQLVSASGKIVLLEKKMLSQKSLLELNVQDFPKGSYFLKIKRGNVAQSVPIFLK